MGLPRSTRPARFVLAVPVGWVERSETHNVPGAKEMGFASAQPILRAKVFNGGDFKELVDTGTEMEKAWLA
jgi:hypothetical protein